MQEKEHPTSAETLHLIPELRPYLNQPARLGIVLALYIQAAQFGQRLTPLNYEVGVGVVETRTYEEAAAQQHRSQSTVRKHFYRINTLTGLNLRVEAFRLWALRRSNSFLEGQLVTHGNGHSG